MPLRMYGEGRSGGNSPDATAAPRPPVLLSMGDWFGTLAAVRERGRRGVEVRAAPDRLFDRSAWSRYARRVRAPGIGDVNEYLGWLKQAGAPQPGAGVLGTSDDLSLVYPARPREVRELLR